MNIEELERIGQDKYVPVVTAATRQLAQEAIAYLKSKKIRK